MWDKMKRIGMCQQDVFVAHLRCIDDPKSQASIYCATETYYPQMNEIALGNLT